MNARLFFASVLLAPHSPLLATTSWPAWRGPDNTGVAHGAKPPTAWADDKNVKWKTEIPGSGFSTPIVWENRIFLLTAIDSGEKRPGADTAPQPQPEPPADSPGPQGDKRGRPDRRGGGPGFGSEPAPTTFHEFAVVAIDRRTGAIEWKKTARREVPHEGHHSSHGFASASPVTDGKNLWVSFGSRGIFCFDLAGNKQWESDLGDMRTRGGFGEGASPALAGDRLIVNWDHEDQCFIVALDAKTGREIWRRDRDEISGWTTPVIVNVDGRTQAIVGGKKQTRSYDTKTGELVWTGPGLTTNVIPTPVVGHGMVFMMSGFQGNAIHAIKLSAKGEISETPDVVWTRRRSAPYVPSPVLSGNLLYMSKSNDAMLSCLDALTGEPHYQDTPLPGVRGLYGSPVAANGYIYIVGRQGTAVVIKDATIFEIVSTNTLADRFDASPVLLDREIYLRGHKYLYCIAEG